MKTIPLRTLIREPLKVKRMTRTGKPVQVTDNGKPLWILQSANAADSEPERLRVTDEILEEVHFTIRSETGDESFSLDGRTD
jgi:hypothetical protein